MCNLFKQFLFFSFFFSFSVFLKLPPFAYYFSFSDFLNFQKEFLHSFLQSQLYADDSFIFTPFSEFHLSSTILTFFPALKNSFPGLIQCFSNSTLLNLTFCTFLSPNDVLLLFLQYIPHNLSVTLSFTIHILGFTFDSSLSRTTQTIPT